MKKSLLLNGLEIYVSLGCSEEEKAFKQKVELDLELVFLQDFIACNNDNLHDTICYYTLRNKIQVFCDSFRCDLIEYLAQQIYDFIVKSYPNVEVEYLKLIKRPPVSQIATASFVIRK